MDPLTLACELGLLIWAAVVLRRHGWRTDRSGLVWTMTAGALITNVSLYVVLLPMFRTEVESQEISAAALYGFLAFRTLEWALMVHVFTRLALVLGSQCDLPGDRLQRQSICALADDPRGSSGRSDCAADGKLH